MTPAMLAEAQQEMERMDAAMRGELSGLQAMAEMLGLRPTEFLSEAIGRRIPEVMAHAAYLNRHVDDPHAALVFAGLCEGIAFAAAVRRVLDRARPDLQAVINGAWDAANEFRDDPQVALSAVCERLERVVSTDG